MAVDDARLLKTTEASVGEVVESRSIRELPLNGRMLIDLVLTVPGAHLGHGGRVGLHRRELHQSRASVLAGVCCWTDPGLFESDHRERRSG